MNNLEKKHQIFARRKARIRAKVYGTSLRPRLSIFKSHRYLYAQIINDEKGQTLAAADSRQLKGKTPVEKAKALGHELAKIAKTAKISKVVFDRNGYLYAGKVRVVADAAREGGLDF